MRGKFITIEGIEGVGKSTNLEFLAALIDKKGYPVLVTREPGGTPLAERIRDMLLEHGDEPLPAIAELLLFFASRSLHIANTIKPALESGTWVLCDRFTDASRAYQGYGRGLGVETVDRLAGWVHKDLTPDLTLLLDAPAEVGKERAENRGATDRLDAETAAFYQRVRDGYLSLASAEPERFLVVDAGKPLDQVQAQIAREMDRFFSDKSH
ncbi:MAG: dTMP kinase [Woeseiaceae bacterium]|nr:dTMP kinase [Woeseiaceae bacterium]